MVNHLSCSGVLIETDLWRTAVLVRGADCESFELLRCARRRSVNFTQSNGTIAGSHGMHITMTRC